MKRIASPMLGFKTFASAQITLGGIEVMHMIRKGQLRPKFSKNIPPFEQFYSLAA